MFTRAQETRERHISMARVIRDKLGPLAGRRELAILESHYVVVLPAPKMPGCEYVSAGLDRFTYRRRDNTIVG